MADYFALLNEPRRPLLDADLLKQKFLALASDAHPDRAHNASESEKAEVTQRYAQLNAAYNCLAEPKLRLLHLLELERFQPRSRICSPKSRRPAGTPIFF